MTTATARENCLLRNRPSTACQNQILRGVSSAIGGSSVRLSLSPKSISPACPQSVDESRPLRANSVDTGDGASGARMRLRPPAPGDSSECQSGSLVVFVTASRLANSGSTNTGMGEAPVAATAMARFWRESRRAGVSWILGRRTGARRSALMCGNEAGFSSWRSSFGSSCRNVSTAQNCVAWLVPCPVPLRCLNSPFILVEAVRLHGFPWIPPLLCPHSRVGRGTLQLAFHSILKLRRRP